jgi:hypothetical protein
MPIDDALDSLQLNEYDILNSLISQRAEEIQQIYAKPEFKEAAREFFVNTLLKTMEILENSSINTYGSISEEDKLDFLKEINNMVDKLVNDEEKIKNDSYNYATNEFKPYDNINNLLVEISSPFSEMIYEEMKLDFVSNFNKNITYLADQQNEYVTKLVSVGLEKGIDYILDKEIQNKITRETFPEREDYEAYLKKGTELSLKFIEFYKNNLDKIEDKEERAIYSSVLDSTQDMLISGEGSKIGDILGYSKLNEIYGVVEDAN